MFRERQRQQAGARSEIDRAICGSRLCKVEDLTAQLLEPGRARQLIGVLDVVVPVLAEQAEAQRVLISCHQSTLGKEPKKLVTAP
jgi:hypothetical protein